MNKRVFYKEKAFLFKECADRCPDRDLLSLFDEWTESKDFSDEDKAEIFKKFISIIPNRMKRQILIPKLNIHLRHDPIALRDITRFILLAIELGEAEEKKEGGGVLIIKDGSEEDIMGHSGVVSKEIRRRKIAPKLYEFIIDVEYIPFPDEKRREEAYDTHVRLFLRAKERMLKMKKVEATTPGNIVRNSQIKKAYKVIDEVMQEVILAEEESLCRMYTLLEEENEKFESEIIKEVIAILKQWNKIPATEIKAKVEAIKSQKI